MRDITKFTRIDYANIHELMECDDYVNIYELREIREWWEKLTKPRLFNLPRIRLQNLWYEFLYIMGV